MGMQLIVYQSHAGSNPVRLARFLSMWTRGSNHLFLKRVIAGSNPAIDSRFMGMSANGRRTGFQSVKESSILSIPTRF
jgi:hypothetical protein